MFIFPFYVVLARPCTVGSVKVIHQGTTDVMECTLVTVQMESGTLV